MRKYLFLIFSVFTLSVCVPQISVNELYVPKEEVDERIGLYMYYPYFTRELAFLNDVITKRFGTACEHKNELISNRYSHALLNIASDSVPKRKGVPDVLPVYDELVLCTGRFESLNNAIKERYKSKFFGSEGRRFFDFNDAVNIHRFGVLTECKNKPISDLYIELFGKLRFEEKLRALRVDEEKLSVDEKRKWLLENNITEPDFYYELKYDIALKNNILTVLFIKDDMSDVGCGNHQGIYTINYDIKNGKMLTVEDVSTLSSTELDDYCVNFLKEKYGVNDDSLNVFRSHRYRYRYAEFSYFDGNLVLYMEPYSVACGAAGIIAIPVN